MTAGRSAAIELTPGALATERRLLEALSQWREESRADPRLLADPIRVLVPSRSLRVHVGERVASELGAYAGLAVQTLHGAAIEALERAGVELPRGDERVEIVVRRVARRDPVLVEAFGSFHDGFRAVVAAVKDLLDAAFEPALEPALSERIDALALPAADRRRAHAVVRVASRVAAELDELGIGGRFELLRRAREVFEAAPERALPSRQIVIHGFADATGRAAEWIESLVRRAPTCVYFDHPSDPLDPARADLGATFTEQLLGRLRGVAGVEELARDVAPPKLDLFRAPGAEAEVRETARRVRAELSRGVPAERIGVVARDLTSYGSSLRRHFTRLGIPFSAQRARAPIDGAGRRIHALLELMEAHDQTPTDRWFDALARVAIERKGEKAQRRPWPALQLGMRIVGAARLGDAAELRLEERLGGGPLRLPVRTAIASGDDRRAAGGDGPSARERSRGFHVRQARLAEDDLASAVAAATATTKRLKRWPSRASLAEHLDVFARLRQRDLRWRASDRAEQRLRIPLERLSESLPDEELTLEEFTLLIARALSSAAHAPLGGDGGGVQVLDAMEARARTFDVLFVLGLNRDVFPRVVREDPLLGDDVRSAMRDLLPDVPIKARGRDEDRYLFAQLVSASPHVAVSWQQADDAGKPKVVSPLVERLLFERGEDSFETIPPTFSQNVEHLGRGGPHTAHEHSILAGLHAGRAGLEPRLALALDRIQPGRGAELARARYAALDAFERGPFEPHLLAPWLGFLGSLEQIGVRPDPRAEAQFVTRFESMAQCPWKTVLTKFLRLEEAPDPLEALPGIEPRIVGNIVHKVLQRIAESSMGTEERALEKALARQPVPWSWPTAEALDALLYEVTADEVRAERAPQPGWVRTLAACAQPRLDRAREIIEATAKRWPEGGILGAEVEGRAQVPGTDVSLAFRADSVERHGEKTALIDYKTGKPVSPAELKKKGIPQGRHLQPMTYVLGAEERGHSARGSYLFLAAEGDEEYDVGVTEASGVQADFARAIETLTRGWVAGTFFPRLYDEKSEREPKACAFCEVSQACLRGDSGARRAMLGWSRADESNEGGQDELRAVLQELWGLATREHGSEE